MNRRSLLQGIAGVVGGLLLPPSVADAAEEVERRYWALGAMPGQQTFDIDIPVAEWMYSGFSFRVGERVPLWVPEKQDYEWGVVTSVRGPYPVATVSV